MTVTKFSSQHVNVKTGPNEAVLRSDHEQRGILPRTFELLFDSIAQADEKVGYDFVSHSNFHRGLFRQSTLYDAVI